MFIDTEYSADAVVACPAKQGLVAVGTYQVLESGDDAAKGATTYSEDASNLDNDAGTVSNGCSGPTLTAAAETQRTGRILLYSASQGSSSELKTLNEVARVDTAAILDMKWQPTTDDTVLAVADATGSTTFYRAETASEDTTHSLTEIARYTNPYDKENKVLQLSLDWAGLKRPDDNRILVTDHSGCAKVLDYSQMDGQPLVSRWKAHEFEAWIGAFDNHSETTLFTGGDDAALRVWDTRLLPVGDEDDNVADGMVHQAQLTNRTTHSAGVCSILSHHLYDNMVFTGSYDDNLRTWDKRSMRVPVAEFPMEGGVWRIKVDPRCPQRLLLACMYRGFAVVEFSDSLFTGIDSLTWYERHKSIAYGCGFFGDSALAGVGDAQEATNELRNIATCSFYDHSLQTWGYDPKTKAVV